MEFLLGWPNFQEPCKFPGGPLASFPSQYLRSRRKSIRQVSCNCTPLRSEAVMDLVADDDGIAFGSRERHHQLTWIKVEGERQMNIKFCLCAVFDRKTVAVFIHCTHSTRIYQVRAGVLMRYWCVFFTPTKQTCFCEQCRLFWLTSTRVLDRNSICVWNESMSHDISVRTLFVWIHTYGTTCTYFHFWFLTASYPILIQSSCFSIPLQAAKKIQSV